MQRDDLSWLIAILARTETYRNVYIPQLVTIYSETMWSELTFGKHSSPEALSFHGVERIRHSRVCQLSSQFPSRHYGHEGLDSRHCYIDSTGAWFKVSQAQLVRVQSNTRSHLASEGQGLSRVKGQKICANALVNAVPTKVMITLQLGPREQ
ncbi:hypothetical protein BDR05DRAFT_963987 [Suillus weaverae]|nr:hypothetical protein BDR05DRAFT_963987 [Suillus weaverae]